MRRFRVAGLAGADCAVRVEASLLTVPGVHNAFVDLEHEMAIVRTDQDVPDIELAEAVDIAGYTLLLEAEGDELQPPEEPYNPDPSPEPDPEPEPAPPPAPIAPPRRVEPVADPEPDEGPSLLARIWYYGWRTVVGCFVFSIVLTLLYRFLPVPTTLLMLGETIIDGKSLQQDWQPLERISPNLIRSVIASEDNDFCRHWGFDFKELEDALKDSKRGQKLRGASTISQQTAKNVFLWPGRSWVRKGIEVYFTLLIEGLWPKRRIMEVYLNVIEWGPGVFGAEAASRKWFRKPASKLTRLEAARLAAILPSPKRWKANPPGAYVNSRGYTISARANSVNLNGDDRCARP